MVFAEQMVQAAMTVSLLSVCGDSWFILSVCGDSWFILGVCGDSWFILGVCVMIAGLS